MKSRGCLVVVGMGLLLLASVFSSGQTIYDNGPIFGEADAWTINEGFAVSDTFTVSQGTSQINGVVFGAWVFPGDVVESVEISITSQEFGGTTYFDQQVSFTQSDCMTNHYGFNLCDETGSFNGPTLGNGTYWLNLSNAVANTGDPVYWDENSGMGCTSPGCPSQASENSVGTIPSESFTVLGSSTSGGGSVPEPGSLFLFAGALLSGAGMMWRKVR
jgi:hypothetical protein